MVKISCGKDNILNKFDGLKLVFLKKYFDEKNACIYFYLVGCLPAYLFACLFVSGKINFSS